MSQREAYLQKTLRDLNPVKRGVRGKSVRSVSDLSSFEHLGGAQPCLFFQPEKRVSYSSVTRVRDQAPMHSLAKAVSLMSSYSLNSLNFHPQGDEEYREPRETYF